MARRNQSTINEEVTFAEGEELVSTTDLRGVVTYANETFCRVAGFTLDELVENEANEIRKRCENLESLGLSFKA